MLNKKRIMPIFISLFLLIAAGGYAFAAGFSDIKDHWAESQISEWAENGLVSGYSDGTFKPNNMVTRAEFVILTNNAFSIAMEGYISDFSDVAVGQWYYNDIAAASASGYIGGYPDGTFNPNQYISRQEAASIIVRLMELEPTVQGLDIFKDADQIPQWSCGNIGSVVEAGLMDGYPDATFQPGKSITRAEAVVFLDRARDIYPEVLEKLLLQGTVTLDNKPVSNVTVRVFKADSYEMLEETETGSDGKFNFTLVAGNYDITAVTEDQVAYQGNIVLAQDRSTTADLELVPAAIITGTLYDKNGKNKVKKAEMLFTKNYTFVTFTGSDGKFTAIVLPDRTYTVRVYEPGEEDEEPVSLDEDVEVGSAGVYNVGILKAPFVVSSGGGGGGGGSSSHSVKPYINSITNGSVDQQNKVITLNKDPGNLTESQIELYSPSGQSILKITFDENLLGSWEFVDGFNDITLGNSIEGVNVSITTMIALLGAGLNYQDMLDIVNYSQVFNAIKNNSNKQEFYDDVLKEIIDIASDDLSEEGRRALYEALNISAIYNAADTATKQKIRDVLQSAVGVYNDSCASESDKITVEDLFGSNYVDILVKINASDCKEAFYDAINISELYEAIAGKSALYAAINESDIIDVITQNAGQVTIIAMVLVVYEYLDDLDSVAKGKILNAVDFNKLMVVVSDNLGNDLQVIVKDKEDDTIQTIYTVTVQ